MIDCSTVVVKEANMSTGWDVSQHQICCIHNSIVSSENLVFGAKIPPWIITKQPDVLF